MWKKQKLVLPNIRSFDLFPSEHEKVLFHTCVLQECVECYIAENILRSAASNKIVEVKKNRKINTENLDKN